MVDSLADHYKDTLQDIRPYILVLVGMAEGNVVCSWKITIYLSISGGKET